MMRGGASVLAAPLFFCLLVPVASRAQTRIVRTRDAGFAAVHYDNGLTLGAMTLYQGLEARHNNSSTALDGVLSIFNDGRWSVQGFFEGAAVSEPVAVAPRFSWLFTSLRGEGSIGAATSAQAGLMPSLQLTARSRLYFDDIDHGAALGSAVARTFDGRSWQTTLMGEASAWLRRSTTLFSIRSTPMQLANGDVLSDTEAAAAWSHNNTSVNASVGARFGEVDRNGTVWGALAVTLPLHADLWATLSVGSYPQDLLQSLPGGRYTSIAFRLPNGKFPSFHRPPPPPPPPPRPTSPELPTTERLALVIGAPLDPADLREIRVWAAGVDDVQLLADFVDWIPVPLVRQPDGSWRGYYRVSAGAHRFNLLLNGTTLEVPTNHGILRQRDEFQGDVGFIIVR
jgi:hypothetical protein